MRWTVLLCLGLFLALQIGGKDIGQKRFGLLQGERDALEEQLQAQALAPQPEDTVVTKAAGSNPGLPDALPVPVAFATTPRLIAQVTTPAAPAPTVAAAPAPPSEEAKVMYVSGRSVNVRGGPSTRTPVLGKLTRGEAVSVIWVEANGWARIRIEGDGEDGYISASFLTENNLGN